MCRFYRSFEDKLLDFLGCKSRVLIRILLAITFITFFLELSVNLDSSCGFIVFMNTVMECIFDGQMSYPIQLSSDYLNEVFSAICTIAVLGNAILSMLFGVYDKKTLGIPFQDVLNHSLIGEEQRFTIKALTISILLAVVFYVLRWTNFLFSTLIQDVFLLLFSCVSLWKFLTDRNAQKAVITEIVEKVDASQYAVYVDSWFKELDGALVPNNVDEAQQYIDLINLVMECCPDRKKQIQACVWFYMRSQKSDGAAG
ncbi:MAG: hypothetical protein IKT52_02350 [Oscillospiraceae bacterium]|nr:hypothetical protein [Oscillospiraceae bacterium]